MLVMKKRREQKQPVDENDDHDDDDQTPHLAVNFDSKDTESRQFYDFAIHQWMPPLMLTIREWDHIKASTTTTKAKHLYDIIIICCLFTAAAAARQQPGAQVVGVLVWGLEFCYPSSKLHGSLDSSASLAKAPLEGQLSK